MRESDEHEAGDCIPRIMAPDHFLVKTIIDQGVLFNANDVRGVEVDGIQQEVMMYAPLSGTAETTMFD
jgi:hypothetical protein